MSLRHLAESRIVADIEICNGKPRIKGTKITVADILLSLAEGLSNAEIMRSYRSLQADDIKAALTYAFCVADGVKLNIKSAFDLRLTDNEGSSPALISSKDEEMDLFGKALAEQAAIQEEITKETIAELKAQKSRKTISPQQVEEKTTAPKERPYDLLIDISEEPKTRIFKGSEPFEQGLDMSLDNYIFEKRSDGQLWLCYSTKDGVEIDQAMKRNLLVTYKDEGDIKKQVFEGYLTTDRQNKIFIERQENETAGRAL